MLGKKKMLVVLPPVLGAKQLYSTFRKTSDWTSIHNIFVFYKEIKLWFVEECNAVISWLWDGEKKMSIYRPTIEPLATCTFFFVLFGLILYSE